MQITFTFVVSLSRQSIKNFANVRRITNEGASSSAWPISLACVFLFVDVTVDQLKFGSIVNSGCHMHCLFSGSVLYGRQINRNTRWLVLTANLFPRIYRNLITRPPAQRSLLIHTHDKWPTKTGYEIRILRWAVKATPRWPHNSGNVTARQQRRNKGGGHPAQVMRASLYQHFTTLCGPFINAPGGTWKRSY